ncbi:non-ribosomal peptide synthase [Xenorhabdus beddingii]|uniref:Non-ribosomal peptide synthase n=1 Tax=Xenorhabdus beddingii TaxID=40578 RepID=A0A1Y2SU68_9GAMM|nr:acyl carrier protein [Xenorhabdus beddingii]OTA21793.1 non-ribosomal peptide synthase [Xenorhabdus beddingii]
MENGVQTKILLIWEDIIGSKNVDPATPFLEQGANSLHLIKLAALVSKELNTPVSSGEVFLAGNINALANNLTNA